jgi:hypothetical protein
MKRTELFEAPLTAERGVLLATVELMPGDAAPRHMHPGDEILYVVEGSVVVEVEGSPPRPSDREAVRSGHRTRGMRLRPRVSVPSGGQPCSATSSYRGEPSGTRRSAGTGPRSTR